MRTYLRVKGERAEEIVGEVVREQPLTVTVDGERFITLLCSPVGLEALLRVEGRELLPGHVRFEPGAGFLAEGLLLGGVDEIHVGVLFVFSRGGR